MIQQSAVSAQLSARRKMMRQWEEFPVGPSGRGPNDLRVTLSRKGEIMVGVKAFEKLGRPEVAVLLFDRKSQTIGVCPADEKAANGFPLIPKKKCRHRIVRANLFCRHYGIRVERTVAFHKPLIDEDGVLVLDLKRATGIGK